MGPRPVFYFDTNSPYAWLAAERVNQVLPELPVWRPISFGFVLMHTGRTPWSLTDERESGQREIERRAAERGLPPVVWPENWPLGTYSLTPLRAATFAAQTGRAEAFAQAAFRQIFNAGRDLSQLDNVLIAAAACELHPRAVIKGIETASIKERLQRDTEEAIELGVAGVPTVAVGEQLFWGDDRLQAAAAACAA